MTTRELTDYDVTDAMLRYGGSFVEALGALFNRADAINRAKLKAAFPEYFETYLAIAAGDASKVQR